MTYIEKLASRGLKIGDYVTCEYRMPSESQPWIHPVHVGVIVAAGEDPKQWNGSNSEAVFCGIAGVVKVQYFDVDGKPSFCGHDRIDSLVATPMKRAYWMPTSAASWYEHRFNVVPWGEKAIANHMPSRFVDSLDEARAVRASMLEQGASDVHVYDTVDGVFH